MLCGIHAKMSQFYGVPNLHIVQQVSGASTLHFLQWVVALTEVVEVQAQLTSCVQAAPDLGARINIPWRVSSLK